MDREKNENKCSQRDRVPGIVSIILPVPVFGHFVNIVCKALLQFQCMNPCLSNISRLVDMVVLIRQKQF